MVFRFSHLASASVAPGETFPTRKRCNHATGFMLRSYIVNSSGRKCRNRTKLSCQLLNTVLICSSTDCLSASVLSGTDSTWIWPYLFVSPTKERNQALGLLPFWL